MPRAIPCPRNRSSVTTCSRYPIDRPPLAKFASRASIQVATAVPSILATIIRMCCWARTFFSVVSASPPGIRRVARPQRRIQPQQFLEIRHFRETIFKFGHLILHSRSDWALKRYRTSDDGRQVRGPSGIVSSRASPYGSAAGLRRRQVGTVELSGACRPVAAVDIDSANDGHAYQNGH